MQNIENGFTVWGYDADTTSDWYGKPRVYGRFETKEELDNFFQEINSERSGWLPEELASLYVENSKKYMIQF